MNLKRPQMTDDGILEINTGITHRQDRKLGCPACHHGGLTATRNCHRTTDHDISTDASMDRCHMRARLYPRYSALVLCNPPELRCNLGERGEGKFCTALDWMTNGHKKDSEDQESSIIENIFVLKLSYLHVCGPTSHTHFTYKSLTWVDQLLSN